ncbi:hypothetical protein BT93_I0247 [Corymbia citriodora subsp. variegata]|nr:hypothetical protein BT93_I0247 [Corymbia citriodora subsp. variegata]
MSCAVGLLDAQKVSRLLTALLCVFATMALAEGTARRYRWMVKYEFTPPKGYKKLSITVNGQTPGPTISAHQGDILIIEVTNGLAKENLAIQWHGMRQIGEAMTQRAIRPGNTLRFRFVADRLGKYPYYAHYKMQREAGLYGWIRVLPRGAGSGVPFKGVDKVG